MDNFEYLFYWINKKILSLSCPFECTFPGAFLLLSKHNRMVHLIIQNPHIGASRTVYACVIGTVLPVISPEVQHQVIFYFQVVAFAVSITVGILTIFGFIRKSRERKINHKKEL